MRASVSVHFFHLIQFCFVFSFYLLGLRFLVLFELKRLLYYLIEYQENIVFGTDFSNHLEVSEFRLREDDNRQERVREQKR